MSKGPGWRLRLTALLLLSTMAAHAAAVRVFDIAAGPATRGITRFAQQAGLPVLFPYDLLLEHRTQALHGRYEIDVALQTLLRGTGLISYINSSGQLTIRPAPPAIAPVDPSTAQERPLESGEELSEVSVTGSRIQRDRITTPTPIAAITSVELETMGLTTLVDALVQLPYFLNNDTPQTQSFGTTAAAGASHLNLRGIGSIRTLTLLDGRRMVPSSRFGTVDIALVPQYLLRRVEVVTGGASAAYGSDAVSGVVNLMLDSDFQGLRTHVQGGITDRGDYENASGALTFGTAVGEQSNLVLSAEAFRAEGIRGYNSRDWFDGSAAILNPDPAGPREILARDVHATGFTYGGLITSGPLAGTQFLAGGAPAPFVRGTLYTNATQSGGSGQNPAADLVWMLPDQRRINTFARFTTRPTARLSAFAQLLAGRTENAFGKDPPSLWGSWEATIFRDNAFLPQQIGTRMADAGISSFRLGRVAANGELGNGMARLTNKLLAATAGMTWHLENWSLDGYYQNGRNRSLIGYEDILRIDRIYRAIDSVFDPTTGNIVCRSTLSFPQDGCVPVNLFGEGSVSAAARDWVTEGSSSQRQVMDQQMAELALRGDLPLLPAGRMSVATGASWRLESARTRSHRYPQELESLRIEPAALQGYRGLPAAYSGLANIFERTTTVNMDGQYAVWEVFGEALAPLLRDHALARRLDLQTAVRLARYSGSGTIPAWKIGLDWEPSPALRLRATRSRDVRAGSLSERFDAASTGVTIVDRVLVNTPSYAIIARREGNPAVDPEKSDTTTVGFLLQPTPVPGLSISTDYYDIHVRDVIALYGAQNIIDDCAKGEQELCDRIERSETGLITQLHNGILNIAGARARGVDFEVSWRRPVQWLGGGEAFALRLFGNRTLESSTTDATGKVVDRTGQTGLFGGAPRLQANLSLVYDRAPLRFTLQQRYISSGSYDATYTAQDLDQRHVRSATYTNLRLDWHLAAIRGATVTLNVQNLFDENPPNAADWGFGGSLPTNEGLFDILGRRFVLGLRYER